MKTNTNNTTPLTPDSDADELTKLEDKALAEAQASAVRPISVVALNKIHELLDYLAESAEWRETVDLYRELLPAKVV